MPLGKYGTPIVKSITECFDKRSSIVKRDYTLEPLSVGGYTNVYTLHPDSQSVVLIAKVCGFQFGRFVNTSVLPRQYKIGNDWYEGTHSEDQFLATWDEAWDMDVMKEIRELRSAQSAPVYVSIKLSKSPCHVCARKLEKFMEAYGVKLRLKVLSLYHGDQGEIINSYSLLSLMSKGAVVKYWDVMNQGKGYRKTTRLGQQHELKYITRPFKPVVDRMELQDNSDTKEEEERKKLQQLYSELQGILLQKKAELEEQLSKRLKEMQEEMLKGKKKRTEKKQEIVEDIFRRVVIKAIRDRDLLDPVLYADAPETSLNDDDVLDFWYRH